MVIVEEDGVKRFSTGELVSEADVGYYSVDQIQQILRPLIKQASLTGESVTIALEGRAFFETAETVSVKEREREKERKREKKRDVRWQY